jgi:hypothetical protein
MGAYTVCPVDAASLQPTGRPTRRLLWHSAICIGNRANLMENAHFVFLFRVSAARHSPGKQSYDPLSEVVVFDISSEGRCYRASITGLLIDRSVTYEELFPWLGDVPPQVQFRIKGKTLYFLDSKNKQHKAEIVPSPEPHSPRN